MTVSLLNFLLYFHTQRYKYMFIYKYNIIFIGLLDIFWDFGLIYGYKVISKTYIIVYPKKTKLNSKLYQKLEFCSLPSRRVFISYDEFYNLVHKKKGYTFFIISTPQGYMDGFSAIKKGLGGELILKINF